MKLISISASNFEGQAIDLKLADVNFLIGSNFSGKTSVANAIKILLLGYLPELGKTARASFGLASGRAMTVSGEFDNGVSFSRIFRLKGDSVVSETATTGGDNFKELLDGIPLAAMLDASTYLSLTDRERVDYLFANLDIKGDPVRLDLELGRRLGMHEKKFPNERIIAITRSIFAEIYQGRIDPRPSDAVSRAIDGASETARSARSYADRMEKGMQAVEQLRSGDEPSRPVADLEKALEENSSKTQSLNVALGSLQAAKREEEKNVRRRETLRTFAAELKARRFALDGFNQQLGTLEEAMRASTSPSDEAVRESERNERDLDVALRGHVATDRDIREKLRDLEREAEGIDARDKCPYCGAKGEGWKRTKASEIDSAIAGLRSKIETMTGHITNVGISLADARTRRNELNRDRELSRDFQHRKLGLDASVAVARRQLEDSEKAERELAEIGDAPRTAALSRMTEVEESLAALSRERRDLEAQRSAAVRRSQDLKRVAEAEGARDRAKVDLDLAKAAETELREMKAGMVEKAFKPLLESANSFFTDILSTPIAYNPDGGELGTWRSGVWVPHHLFSGTEKALAYAAIQAALAARSPIKIMIIDELARLDDRNAERLMYAVDAALASGRIDTFVGIDTFRAAFWRGWRRTDRPVNIVEMSRDAKP